MMRSIIFELLIQLFEARGTSKQSETEYFQYCVETLEAADLSKQDFDYALSWLEKFNKVEEQKAGLSAQAYRVFSPEECRKINTEGRNFLLQLLKFGAIDKGMLEQVMDCAMELEVVEIDLNQLKWMVVMLASAELKNQAYAEWLDYTILQADSPERILH